MSTLLSSGANTNLTGTAPYQVVITHDAGPDVDLTAFALNGAEKVRSDADMVFYNQNLLANDGVEWVPPVNGSGSVTHTLRINPGQWPGGIERVRIGLTVDGGLTFGKVANLKANVVDASGAVVAEFDLRSRSTENAFIVADIYQRDRQLKAKCQAAGFTNGLAGLARDVGVSIDDEPAEAAVETPQPTASQSTGVNFVKRLAEAELPPNASAVDLRKKKLAVVLVKSNLDGKIFRVVLLIDASGSMRSLYAGSEPVPASSSSFFGRKSKQPASSSSTSVVQRSLERMVPVADLLDDNHEMEVWYFGSRPSRSESVTIATMEGYVTRTWEQKLAADFSNDEVAAMEDVMRWVNGNPSPYPTIVLAWSDGGVGNENAIKRFLVKSSSEPVFWMWLGLGGNKNLYGALTRLDEITGGVVDNAGFMHIDNIESMTDEKLYEGIFQHVSRWVREAIPAGVIPR